MLNDVVRVTISGEPDMTIVDAAVRGEDDLGAYTKRRRIDVVLYVAGSEGFDDYRVGGMLRANPRLSLLSIDGPGDQGTLHHLVPTHDAIGSLNQSSLTAAIRAGRRNWQTE
jgi:hypothetical protein